MYQQRKSKSRQNSSRNNKTCNSDKSKVRGDKSLTICIPAPIYPSSEHIPYEQTFLDKIKASCNQSNSMCYLEIETRLKMSYIMHRDSKLRNNRHEIDHLLGKFGNELKGRKNIKDKINTNPKVMKKHKMVVDF